MKFTNREITKKILYIGKLHKQRMTELVAEFGMFACDPPLFLYLSKYKNPTQKELADNLNVSAPTMSVTLQRMEKAGFISRRPDDLDARVTRVGLTEKGENLAISAKNALKILEDELMQGFSEEEKTLFFDFLQRSAKNLGGEKK